MFYVHSHIFYSGDCSVWISYDTDVQSPVNWIKIKDFPGCLAADGANPPNGAHHIYIYIL